MNIQGISFIEIKNNFGIIFLLFKQKNCYLEKKLIVR